MKNLDTKGTPLADALAAFNKACKDYEERRLKGIERARNAKLRREAKARGETTYQGTPCSKSGHGTLRVTYNGLCHECHNSHNRAYRARQRAEREALWLRHR